MKHIKTQQGARHSAGLLGNSFHPRFAPSSEIEEEKKKQAEVRRALDEQVERKKNILAEKKTQELTYMRQQEVSSFGLNCIPK
jgi:hypothetical protein